jgi:hypothetical protein
LPGLRSASCVLLPAAGQKYARIEWVIDLDVLQVFQPSKKPLLLGAQAAARRAGNDDPRKRNMDEVSEAIRGKDH